MNFPIQIASDLHSLLDFLPTRCNSRYQDTSKHCLSFWQSGTSLGFVFIALGLVTGQHERALAIPEAGTSSSEPYLTGLSWHYKKLLIIFPLQEYSYA
jgi:hypothetical protein